MYSANSTLRTPFGLFVSARQKRDRLRLREPFRMTLVLHWCVEAKQQYVWCSIRSHTALICLSFYWLKILSGNLGVDTPIRHYELRLLKDSVNSDLITFTCVQFNNPFRVVPFVFVE